MARATATARKAAREVAASDRVANLANDWWNQTWFLAGVGCLLLYLALPPVGWGALAWLTPVSWAVLIRRNKLVGWRPYLTIWIASLVHWLAALYWLTLPHWATSFGWLALSIYLAIYLVAFVALCRVAVHRLRISVILAAPVVWTGLELLQAHIVFGGFAMASIAHSQIGIPHLLQISDVLGSYGVSFLILLVGSCLGRILPCDGRRVAFWPVLPAAVAIGLALFYGDRRLSEQTTEPGPKVGLIQGSIDIDMKHDPTMSQRIFDEYFELSHNAVAANRDLDLLVWPETMFRYPWFLFDDDYTPKDDELSPQELTGRSRDAIENTVRPLHTPLLVGIDVVQETARGTKRYNSGLFVDKDGQVIDRYDKSHLVPFGEYVPFATVFPWLYKLTPLPTGLDEGAGPRAVRVGSTAYAVNICYENTLPHQIRSQVATLKARGEEPDVLVNLTNDGWFWGSSELDMHLACAVFRAIECRKPMLIAANTGFSAWIDSNGRIQAQGPRRATDVIVAPVSLDRRASPYVAYGDWFAGLCLAMTLGILACGLAASWRQRRRAVPTSP